MRNVLKFHQISQLLFVTRLPSAYGWCGIFFPLWKKRLSTSRIFLSFFFHLAVIVMFLSFLSSSTPLINKREREREREREGERERVCDYLLTVTILVFMYWKVPAVKVKTDWGTTPCCPSIYCSPSALSFLVVLCPNFSFFLVPRHVKKWIVVFGSVWVF